MGSAAATFLPPIAGHGVSQEAISLRKQLAEIWSRFFEPVSLGQGRLDALNDLEQTWSEYSQVDWDGYGSGPIQLESVLEGQRFLLALPVNAPAPAVALDPDGEVEFEWYVSPTWLFSASIGGDSVIRYAGLFGRNEKSGKELFQDEVPEEILNNIRRLYQAQS